MYASVEDGLSSQYNVCPTVEFNFDGTGLVNGSLKPELFYWYLRSNELKIRHNAKSVNTWFNDTTYTPIFKKHENRIDLTIVQTKGKNSFYLSKTISSIKKRTPISLNSNISN